MYSDSAFHIMTTGGDTLADRHKYLYVMIDNRHFIRKRPYELNIGDMLAFPKPYVSSNLDDVAPYLVGSPRYSRALDALHETNSRGERIPKLRIMLIRSLMDTGFFGSDPDRAEIEQKIMKDGDDFTPTEIELMEQRVRQILVRGCDVNLGGDAPSYWLRGITIAPYGFDRNGQKILQALSEGMNPEFGKWEYGNTDPKGIFFNYRLYRVIRNKIMWYLNECRGTHIGTDRPQRNDRGGISVSPEFELIFKHFLKDISSDLAATRVTNVKEIESRSRIREMRKSIFDMQEGMGKERQSFLNDSLKSIAHLMTQERLLYHYFVSFIEDFTPLEVGPEAMPRLGEVTGLPCPKRTTREYLARSALPTLFRIFNEPLDNEYQLIEDLNSDSHVTVESTQRYVDTLVRHICDGDVDAELNFERGTTSKLIEACSTSRKAIPGPITEYLAFVRRYQLKMLQRSRKDPQRRQSKKRASLMRRGLRSEYDIHYSDEDAADSLFPQKCGRLFTASQKYKNFFFPYAKEHCTHQPTKRELLESEQNRGSRLREIVEESERANSPILTRRDAAEILGYSGLGHIVDVRWQDFLWE